MASHVFRKSVYFGELSSSTFKAQEGSPLSLSQMTVTQKPFEGANQHLMVKFVAKESTKFDLAVFTGKAFIVCLT